MKLTCVKTASARTITIFGTVIVADTVGQIDVQIHIN